MRLTKLQVLKSPAPAFCVSADPVNYIIRILLRILVVGAYHCSAVSDDVSRDMWLKKAPSSADAGMLDSSSKVLLPWQLG